ncbi:MAG TPA: Uma2 family endonuclease [Anaerolineae bacterium]|nr:Uma2 family endonuclease [Anaerolineae bacterium]
MSTVSHLQKDIVYDWFSERLWTEEEYLLFANDQNALIELSDGKVVIHEMPTPQHQAVVLNIAARLREQAEGRTLVAPVPVQLWPGKMREPDVMFFKADHLSRIQEHFAGVPDLVVEVLSPSTRSVDLGEKMDEYARAGIPEYWIVEIDAKNVSIYVLRGASYVLANRVRSGETVQSATMANLFLQVDEMFE